MSLEERKGFLIPLGLPSLSSKASWGVKDPSKGNSLSRLPLPLPKGPLEYTTLPLQSILWYLLKSPLISRGSSLECPLPRQGTPSKAFPGGFRVYLSVPDGLLVCEGPFQRVSPGTCQSLLLCPKTAHLSVMYHSNGPQIEPFLVPPFRPVLRSKIAPLSVDCHSKGPQIEPFLLPTFRPSYVQKQPI